MRLFTRGNLGSDDRLKSQFEGIDPRFGAPTKSHIQRSLLNCSKEEVTQTYLENVFPFTDIFVHFERTLQHHSATPGESPKVFTNEGWGSAAFQDN